MILRNINGKEIAIENKEIESITFPYAFEVMDEADAAGNGIKKLASLICIQKKDGTNMTYLARNWAVLEV